MPHIGDFGLVADIEPPEGPNVDSSLSLAVARPPGGTQLYYPATSRSVCPKLDVYSLGVIAFELVNEYKSNSERIEHLQGLKKGLLPEGFAGNHPMAEGILHMVDDDRQERWDCKQVREWLNELKERHM